MPGYFSILRPLISIAVAVAVYIGAFIGGAELIPSTIFSFVLFGMLASFLIAAGGMIINDIVDANTDASNKPGRPIPSGQLGKKFAAYYALILFIIGNVISYRFLPHDAFYLSIITTILLIAYSVKLKSVPVLGHILVSILISVAFIFGGIIVGNYNAVIPVAVATFLINMAKDVYKTVDDALGDKHVSTRSVSLRFGVHRARLIGNVFLYISVVASFVSFFLGVFDETYMAIAIIADILLLAASVSPAKYSFNLVRIGMILTILAFFIGAYTLRYGFTLPFPI